MNIRQQLLHNYSKESVEAIVTYVGDRTERYAELMQIFLYGEWREVQHASWAVGRCAEKNATLAIPYLPAMMEKIKHPHHNAVQRNVLRLFQFITIPEELLGETVDVCFKILNDPQIPVANRVFSMTILHNACQREPDLANELRETIEVHLPTGSAALRSRGNKILKALKSS